MKKLLFLFVALTVFSYSALAQTRTYREDTQARSADAVQTVFVQPMVMETELVKVEGADEIGKITYTYNLTKKEFRKHYGANLENLKAYTVYKVSQEYGVDAIASTVFFFKSENNKCTLVLSGFPVKYKKMRNATQADYEWMNLLTPVPQIQESVPFRLFNR